MRRCGYGRLERRKREEQTIPDFIVWVASYLAQCALQNRQTLLGFNLKHARLCLMCNIKVDSVDLYPKTVDRLAASNGLVRKKSMRESGRRNECISTTNGLG